MLNSNQKKIVVALFLTAPIFTILVSVDSKPALADCNPFGCSQSSIAECNPFGCPKAPSGRECTPFGCPPSSPQQQSVPQTNQTSGSNPVASFLGGLLGNILGSGSQPPQQVYQPPQQVYQPPQQVVYQSPVSYQTPVASPSVPTDPVAQLLTEWGWTKISCFEGGVYISGVVAQPICVAPTASVPAGKYIYNKATNQLVPLNASLPANNPMPVPVPPASMPQTPASTNGGSVF